MHKSRGDTLIRAVIATFDSKHSKSNFDFQKVHVASSKVREGGHMRLLLTVADDTEKWSSVIYIN